MEFHWRAKTNLLICDVTVCTNRPSFRTNRSNSRCLQIPHYCCFLIKFFKKFLTIIDDISLSAFNFRMIFFTFWDMHWELESIVQRLFPVFSSPRQEEGTLHPPSLPFKVEDSSRISPPSPLFRKNTALHAQWTPYLWGGWSISFLLEGKMIVFWSRPASSFILIHLRYYLLHIYQTSVYLKRFASTFINQSVRQLCFTNNWSASLMTFVQSILDRVFKNKINNFV